MNRVLVAFGVAAVALGVGRSFDVVGPVLPGGTYGFVAVASLAAVAGVVVLYRDGRAGTGASAASPPAPDGPRRPGADATNAVADLRVVARRSDAEDGRHALAERLESLAVDVLVAKRDCTVECARDRLADGSWTDDPEAAAFFREGRLPTLSTRDQLVAVRSGDPPFARRVRRVVAELDRLEGDG